MAIGGSKKTCETFPLYPDVCMRMSKSNFYFFKPPEIKKHHHHGGGDDDDSDDDDEGDDDEEESDEEEEMSDHDAELDQDEEPHHRILIKYRGPTVKQQTEIVVEGKTTIGTDDSCDIVLEDDEMDEHHCTIELDEKSGVFYVVDHDSKNGTYVKLTEKSPFELNYSDVIRLGDSRLHFKHATRLTILSTIDNLFIQAAMFMFQTGQQKRAKFPTSKAHISAGFHSFWLIFGRAIISRNGLEAWMLFPGRARARNTHVEDTLNHPCAAQVPDQRRRDGQQEARAAGHDDDLEPLQGLPQEGGQAQRPAHRREGLEVRHGQGEQGPLQDQEVAVRLRVCPAPRGRRAPPPPRPQ